MSPYIKRNDENSATLRLGGNPVQRVYRGSTIVYEPAEDEPSGTIARQSGDVVAGVQKTFAVTVVNGPVFAVLHNGSAEVGSRVSVASSGTVNLTPAAAGTHTARLYSAASGGTLLHTSASFPVLSATVAITVSTPSSPQNEATALSVSGTYTGVFPSGTVVWRQGGSNVGSSVAISTFSDGNWSTTITTPASDGTYTLRATHGGAGAPTADSGNVTVSAGSGETIATFVFEGTGDGEGSVALFGHSFVEGSLDTNDSILIRRDDTNAEVRVQMTPLATWDDGSVRTAALACELPDLADTVELTVNFRKNESHSSPGTNLAWATALSGRSILIKTWTPGNTITPLWTYNVADALLASSDDWMVGPLAIGRRVATAVSSSHVLNTSGATGAITSVRLVCDVTATKDGALIVDAGFFNDAMHKAGGGIARFGWTIEIDGDMVYDQRPSSGVARDLVQYSAWIKRRGKRGGASPRTYDFYATHRPLFYCDFDVLVESKATLPFETSFFANTADNTIAPALSAGAGSLTDPYYNWGVLRYQPSTGGADHIGLDTKLNLFWMTGNNRARESQIMSHLQAEAFAIGGWLRYDDGYGRPLMPDEWLLWHGNQSNEGSVTTRANALGYPAAQPPTSNATDHIEVDQAHRGDMYGTPALLSGRRMLYDLVAFRASDAVMAPRESAWNGVTLDSTNPSWRTQGAPSHETGVGWGQRWPGIQLRAWAWGFRDIVRAHYLLPDNLPRRDFYEKSVEAFINAVAGTKELINDTWPEEMGLVTLGYGSTGVMGFHANFTSLAFALARRLGWGGNNFALVDNAFALFRAKLALENEALQRRLIDGWVIYLYEAAGGDFDNSVPLLSFADVAAQATNASILANWSNSAHLADYAGGMIAGFLLAARECEDLEVRALCCDALVIMRSHRKENTRPRFFPSDLISATQWPMIHSITHDDVSLALDAAPQVIAGQNFNVDYQAATGAIVGCVNWTGPIPRNSSEGLNATVDAWEITSQPAGDPFTITAGGVLKRSGTGSLSSGSDYTVAIRCRTYGENETLYQGSAVNVTVSAITVAPVLSADQSVDAYDDASVGDVVATFTYTGSTSSVSITAGNTNNLFSVHEVGNKTVEVRVAASLASYVGAVRNLTIQVSNTAGSDTASCTVTVEASIPHVWSTAASSATIRGGWSIARRLRYAYTGPLIRVRRASDNAEQDIGFDGSGELDTAQLATFLSGSQGFLRTVYNQFEAGEDLVQATAGNQMELTDSGGTLHTLAGSSKPAALAAASRGVGNTSVSMGGNVAIQGLGMVVTLLQNPGGNHHIAHLYNVSAGFDGHLISVIDNNGNLRGYKDGGNAATANIAGAVTGTQSIVLGTRGDTAGGTTDGFRLHTSTASASSGVQPVAPIGGSSTPQYAVGLGINGYGPTDFADSRVMRFSEAFTFTGATVAHFDAMLDEQSTYYGLS